VWISVSIAEAGGGGCAPMTAVLKGRDLESKVRGLQCVIGNRMRWSIYNACAVNNYCGDVIFTWRLNVGSAYIY